MAKSSINSSWREPLPSLTSILRKGKPEDNGFVERSHRTDDEEFYRLEKRGFKDLRDFMLKASEWIYYYNYDRSHDGLGGKSPAEVLQEVNPKLPEDILFLPPIILDDRITLLGGGTEVYRHYKATLDKTPSTL